MKQYYLKERIGSRWINLKEGQADIYSVAQKNKEKYQKLRKHEVKVCESIQTDI